MASPVRHSHLNIKRSHTEATPMPTICRLLRLPPEAADALMARHRELPHAVESAKIYADVYRYWHAIEYLLALHRPGSPAAAWLGAGEAVSPGSPDIPPARVLRPAEVAQLDATLRDIEPDQLIPHYDAEALDQAGIYPRRWQAWEETFDPLGQVLEHYSFLQRFARQCADGGDALLLYFTFVDDGSDE
jgi:hypothetical protein